MASTTCDRRVLYPPDLESLRFFLSRVLDTENCMNLVVADKYGHGNALLLDPEDMWHSGFAMDSEKANHRYDITVITVGDVMASQADVAISELESEHGVYVRRIYLADLTMPAETSDRARRFQEAISGDTPTIVLSGASLHSTRAALAGSGLPRLDDVFGYIDPPGPLTGIPLLRHCSMDTKSIVSIAQHAIARKKLSS